MSSRGSRARNGHVTTHEYDTSHVTNYGVKILNGTSNQYHSLPDYSHSPNAVYAKMKSDGKTLHELRIYDKNGNPIIEIAYHPEPKINNGDRQTNIVHFHMFDGLKRSDAQRMDTHMNIKEKYAIYLKEFGLYEKC